ncbi:MAG: hypothetical protein M3P10_08845 [Actinomycetota bacterium]|nr:hypothetical protein [Actinomycetota bacterium]
MKLARSIGLCFFVIAALLQVPTGASATVPNITLPAGDWNVTVTVTGKSAGHTLAFGMTSPQPTEICGDAALGCVPGDALTFSDPGLSGDLVFYLTDKTCSPNQTFQSTQADSARINQIDSTHWTIGWDDAGDCVGVRDHDFNDLEASVVAFKSGTTTDSAEGFYNGTAVIIGPTTFGKGDSMASEIVLPDSTGSGGYKPGQVVDQEKSAKDPAYITFCGNAQCDAQVDVSTLPGGSQSGTTGDPGDPIQVILYYKDNALSGDAVYAQGDDDSTPQLLAKCFSPTMASVNGVDSAKCVKSITTTSGKDKVKKVVVLVPSGNDPIIGKR